MVTTLMPEKAIQMDNALHQLIADCNRGSLKAQREIFFQYQETVFSVCLRYSRDRPEAQDMLQEAFLFIYKDLSRYRFEGSFEGWIKKVTVRAALQFLRRRNPLRLADDLTELPAQNASSWPDTDLMSEAILQLVQQLPAGYRTVFNMHCMEGWSYSEIAEALSISESSVRSQYSRACRQLRDSIEKHLL